MKSEAIDFDRLGFPWMWVPEVGLDVQVLPVTKIQFEAFLCQVLDAHFDDKWYQTALRLNPRISPRRVSAGNYWQAFLTGILPAEAERFGRWMGEGYRLPTEQEWQTIFVAASTAPGGLGSIGAFETSSPRTRELLEKIDTAISAVASPLDYEPDLATSMGLRLGVVEWVTLNHGSGNRWAGLGEPHPGFCGNLFDPDTTTLVRPLDAETRRSPVFGFRLVREHQQFSGSTSTSNPGE